MAHSVTIERRTNGSFAPLVAGEEVKPLEPVRLLATGLLFFSTAEFVILDMANKEVFKRNAGADARGVAFLDIAAPSIEGDYVLTARAQSFPFLSMTHMAATNFRVSRTAPVPITPPPETGLPGLLEEPTKFFKEIKGLLVAGAIILGIVIVSSYLPKKK